MISKKMTEDLNKQINEEITSAYLYLSMSACSTSLGLDGCAKWFSIQAKEEMGHAMKIYSYLVSQQSEVVLLAIQEPKRSFSSIKELLSATLEHEKHITACINKLMSSALEQKDYATSIFLQWFIEEQIEEESSVVALLDRLKLLGESNFGIISLDKEMGSRNSD